MHSTEFFEIDCDELDFPNLIKEETKNKMETKFPLGSLYKTYDTWNKCYNLYQVIDYKKSKDTIILLFIEKHGKHVNRKLITFKNAVNKLTKYNEKYIMGRRCPYVEGRVIFNEQLIKEE